LGNPNLGGFETSLPEMDNKVRANLLEFLAGLSEGLYLEDYQFEL